MPLPGFPAAWGLSVHLDDAPATSGTDVLALWPSWVRDEPNEVIQAVADGAAEASAKHASKIAAYAASTNEQYAVGAKLDFLGAQKGIPRGDGEDDETYRLRLLSDADVATPRAIMDAVDRILAPLTSAQAYYTERPDDDAFIFSKLSVFHRGTYLGAKQPIRRSTRYYAARGRCTPRHILLFRSRRGAAYAGTQDAAKGVYDTTLPLHDDATAPDNARGHVILALPAFLQPGRQHAGDAYVSAKPTGTLSTGSGLTPAAAQKARVLASVFTKASAATRAAASRPSGATIRSSGKSVEFVVSAIRSLLASRAAAGKHYTLFFDPEIV